jgi:GntR family transcriptional repressor for pyruvate dehydrogenase complex
MRTLLADIACGALEPGGAALRESDIAAQFGVSRGVARECIRGLEERGLVSVKPGRGATVNPRERWAVFDPDVLSALLGTRRGADILGECLECRRILEIEAAGLAVERAGDHDLAALADALALMTGGAQRAAVNPAAAERYHEADLAFHRALIAATRNGALGAMLAPLWRALGAARPPLARPAQRIERSIAEHRRILAAIAGRDVDEARAAMRDHLAPLERHLREGADVADRHGAGGHRAA